MMKPKSKPFRAPAIRALILASIGSLALNSYANEATQGGSLVNDELFMQSLKDSDSRGFNPFIIDDTSIRISSNDISVNLLVNNQLNQLATNALQNDPLSFSIEDEQQGQWLVSLDLSHSNTANDVNTGFAASYQIPNKSSQFFVNYGNHSLPVSVSFESPVNYVLDDKNLKQTSTAFGFNQKLYEGWDVTISYMRSDLDLVTTESALAQMHRNSELGYRFYYDFNQDGSPEAINLMSNLAGIEGFQQDLEGIEIKISRQINDDFALGASVELSKGLYQEQSLNFQEQQTPFEASAFSLYGGMRIAKDWTLAANVNKQESKLGLDSTSSNLLMFEDTTLDIGLQYQTKWNKTGLVIRIDLMNLLGAAHLEDSLPQSMDLDARGLTPYTFQSPKYIKLSGSINF
ncbi:MAG: hypothetical protein OQJ80_06860 [Kangiella sp.]|nr:hypothetical protein [Kangiella sp.]